MQTASIGIFDSGFGGLTVMRAVQALLPNENIIYFGDTARIPYGNKSEDKITQWSVENTRFLISLGVKMLIVACHTVCASSIKAIRQASPVPVIGIVEPAMEELLKRTSSGKVGILGTQRTIQSAIYQTLLQEKIPHGSFTAIPCPLFVHIVEEGYVDHPIAAAVAKEYLHPLKTSDIDTLLLGCTHYPLLHKVIQQEIGDKIHIVDPAFACAWQARNLLQSLQLCNNTTQPLYEFYVSDDPEKFRHLGQTFLNSPIEKVCKLMMNENSYCFSP